MGFGVLLVLLILCFSCVCLCPVLFFVQWLYAVKRCLEIKMCSMQHFSGTPDAQIQCAWSHRCDRLWAAGPCQQPGQDSEEWSGLCHPQPAHHRQNGCHQQSMWQHVWSAPRTLCRDLRSAFPLPLHGDGDFCLVVMSYCFKRRNSHGVVPAQCSLASLSQHGTECLVPLK